MVGFLVRAQKGIRSYTSVEALPPDRKRRGKMRGGANEVPIARSNQGIWGYGPPSSSEGDAQHSELKVLFILPPPQYCSNTKPCV